MKKNRLRKTAMVVFLTATFYFLGNGIVECNTHTQRSQKSARAYP